MKARATINLLPHLSGKLLLCGCLTAACWADGDPDSDADTYVAQTTTSATPLAVTLYGETERTALLHDTGQYVWPKAVTPEGVMEPPVKAVPKLSVQAKETRVAAKTPDTIEVPASVNVITVVHRTSESWLDEQTLSFVVADAERSRMILGGNTYPIGSFVDPKKQLRWTGIDDGKRTVYFKNTAGKVFEKRY